MRQPPPLLCENALSTSELYDKVPPTVMAPTSAGTAAAAPTARSSSMAAASSQGGGGSASFDHGHPGRNYIIQLQFLG